MKRFDRDGCDHVNGLYVNYSDVAELQAELDAANASIVELKQAKEDYVGSECWNGESFERPDNAVDLLDEVFNKTPEQSLAAVKADAIREAVKECSTEQNIGGSKWLCRVVDLEEYANKIKGSGQSIK